jgi:hypothetical protein
MRSPSIIRLGAGTLCVAFIMQVTPAASPTPQRQQPVHTGEGLRDVRVPDSVPNISGVWNTPGYNRRTSPADRSETPWLPWSKAEFDRRAEAEKNGKPLFDPTAACLPSGIPRLIIAPYPIEIIQTPDMTVILHETHHLYRIIYMDAKHPAKVGPTYMGHSIGHWEGDTLVVDTVGLTTMTQIDEAGTQHSDALHVVERIRKINPSTLEDTFTIDDPKTFSKPWDARRTFNYRPDISLFEYVCEENNRNAPDASGELRRL